MPVVVYASFLPNFAPVMKKSFAILMLFLYSLSVSGSVVQMHFCGEELESLSFREENASCCCQPEENQNRESNIREADPDCCDNVAVSFKISADQHIEAAPQLLLLQTGWIAAPLHLIPSYIPAAAPVAESGIHYAHAPPGLWQNIPLYRLFGRTVYYG